MSEQEWRDLLESLVELQDAVAEAEEESLRTREYVRREHFPFLDTRFRLYDEYLATRRPQQFMQFVRLLPNEFEDLYESIGGRLQHPSTHAGPINGRQRLMIYLRFVAFGGTFVSFALAAGCGRETVSAIVAEVTDVIIDELHEIAFPPLTRERLQAIANATHDRYDYPRAVGFMDGKHVRIEKPAHSGSSYWNYKNYYSIILLAICDCDYRILLYDVGAAGRAGDAGVYRSSAIKEFLDANDHLFPPTEDLDRVGPVQYHILVDGGFGQDLRFVRPYRDAEADTPEKRRFNSRHSRARRMIESTFGILARRFQILMHPMQVDPARAARIVKALLILHNLLPRRQDTHGGQQGSSEEALHSVERTIAETGASAAKTARERITLYYTLRDGPAVE
ncbi:unnamed protein product [Cylicocyclus nassatus]|uniref:DDE Tnp4 domain-containing protein n=1 Tax=Cylicocyclus nassatus TaxID=53992 RepID=A0AA36H3G7_CYLNA|nr:unnamed protein product [Cylicocyclus nassatus]